MCPEDSRLENGAPPHPKCLKIPNIIPNLSLISHSVIEVVTLCFRVTLGLLYKICMERVCVTQERVWVCEGG
jgi:hypothetical protein